MLLFLRPDLRFLEHIPLPLLALLLGILIWRRMFARFPWFFAYVVFGVCADLARVIVRNRTAPYFYVYWSTEAGYGLMGICVMYEVFRGVLGNLARWKWPRLVFPVMVMVSAALTAGQIPLVPAGLHKHYLMSSILLGEIAVRFLEVLMFCSLVTLVALIGLKWRQYPFGIAAGFGVYATTALMGATQFLKTAHVVIMGIGVTFSWPWILIISYSCGVLIWILFFSAEERPSPPGSTIDTTLAFEQLKLYHVLLRRDTRRKWLQRP